MDISVVIPVFNEQGSVPELHKSLRNVLDRVGKKYEIIFVDDGSTDRTFEVVKGLHRKDKAVRVIRFKKNFGKSDALSAGFDLAKGDVVITMDGDLQDDPREIPVFLEKIKQFDLVVGWKHKRRDPLTKRWPSKIFNKLTAWVTGVKIHDSNCCFKAYRRNVTRNINVYGEMHRYIPALAHWKGYTVGEVKVQHQPRKYGKSKWGSGRLVKGFLDLVTVKFLTGYQKRPLHLFGGLGLLLLLAGFVIGAHLLYLKYFLGEIIGNRPLLLLGVLFIIFGLQSFAIGLLGEMVTSSKETKDYIVDEVV